jgi:hypothetical protein
MKITRLLGLALLPVAFGMVLTVPVQAGDKYQSTIVEDSANATAFSFTQGGSKVSIKPSTKAGDGAIVTQLNAKFIDCPPNNDGGTPGKCGVKDNAICDHVMNLGVRSTGLDLPNIAGIRYCIEKGKTFFPSTGKNKVGGTVLGALVTLIFDQPLGIGLVKLQTPGSIPASCATAPAPATCVDGDIYGVAGIVVGNDSGVMCTGHGDCPDTAICSAGLCAPEPCTIDADCDEGGGGPGTMQCGSNGDCCDPGLDPTCAGQVP